MEWVEQLPVHGPTLLLSRPASQPVFVDPHGHRVRRLRHGARVIAGAAGVYLALLAVGLAGPATSPFSLLPGAGAKAGESGREAVRSGAGGAVNAGQARDAGASGQAVQGLNSPAAGVPAVGVTTPATTPAPVAPPPAVAPAPAAPGRSVPPAASAPAAKSSPKPAPAQGAGPPAGHVPPGQAKKVSGGPGNGGDGNDTGTGNAPPANHGQQMAAEHSRSPNH